MKKLDERARVTGVPCGTASDDMITLAVLNTSSISVMPTTVCALRRAAALKGRFWSFLPCGYALPYAH